MGSHFRTVEVGTLPLAEGELTFITVKSGALRGRADVSLYRPPQARGGGALPVVVLLHGVYCSHWAWLLKAKAHVTLQRMIDAGEIPPMYLATPSDGLWGDGSGFLAHSGIDAERWIVEEVPRVVAEVTGNTVDAPHFIGGLSMGGFGALRLGAKYPDRFRGFAGHSSITELSQMAAFVEEPLEQYRQSDPVEASVFEVIRRGRDRLRPFRFDCGVEDSLIEANRTLAKKLREAGVSFTFEEYPGGHEWAYWEAHVEKSFRFFAGLLNEG